MILLLLLSTRTVAHPTNTATNTDIGDIGYTEPQVVSFEGLNLENKGSSISPLADTKRAVQQVDEAESQASISSIVPIANASLNIGANDALTLSFNVEASGIKRVRFYLTRSGVGTSKYVIRGAAKTYSLAIRDAPTGTYSWRFEVITNSNDNDLKNQKFGPWEFSLQKGKHSWSDTGK